MDLLIFLIQLSIILTVLTSNAVLVNSLSLSALKNNEICNLHNGRRIYVEMGSGGELKATNISVPKDFLNQSDNVNATQLHYQCSLELVTCPTCSLKVTISFSNFSFLCQHPSVHPCSCDYLWLSEPPYDSEQYGSKFCGQGTAYSSKTRTLLIKFIYSVDYNHAFSLEYKAERNHETIIGSPSPEDISNKIGLLNHTISSPFFPMFYPRDYGMEHTMSCSSNACRIRVIFTDFQIATSSTMEFYDTNGQRMDVFSGTIFRPPIIISSGPSLMIRFYANGGTGLGYKAVIMFFIPRQDIDSVIRPNTNCGGNVETLGGAITMMNMLSNETISQTYDCIWLIRPSNKYLHLKTHLSLRVDAFQNLAGPTELTIRQGMSSDRPELATLKWPTNAVVQSSRNYVVSLNFGFYVSLKAVFNSKTRLALVYSAFSYTDCYIGSEFMCQNHRCIPIQLHCDGFDHCGDNSDEPSSCPLEWASEPIDRRWYSHTPNYYFPKMERYPDLKTATAVFMISSVGLIILIAALIILLYRMGARARHQRELQNHLQTISELLDQNNRPDSPPDEPPIYEAPPDYDEVIKVGMENEMRRSNKRRRSDRRSGSRNQRRKHSSHFENAILEVQLPSEDDSLPADQSLDLLMTPHIVDRMAITEASTSSSITISSQNRSCQTTPITENVLSPIVASSQQILDISDTDDELTSRSETLTKGYADESFDLSLSLSMPTLQSDTNLNSCTSNHLWSDQVRIKKHWLVFRNGEPTTVVPEIISSLDSIRINEMNDYLKSYEHNNGSIGSHLQCSDSASTISNCDNVQRMVCDCNGTSYQQLYLDSQNSLVSGKNQITSDIGNNIPTLMNPITSCFGQMNPCNNYATTMTTIDNRNNLKIVAVDGYVYLKKNSCNCYENSLERRPCSDQLNFPRSTSFDLLLVPTAGTGDSENINAKSSSGLAGGEGGNSSCSVDYEIECLMPKSQSDDIVEINLKKFIN